MPLKPECNGAYVTNMKTNISGAQKKERQKSRALV